MKKVLGWFFGILLMLAIVAVILFCTGHLAVKFQTRYGLDIKCTIADFTSDDNFIEYITKEQGCTFDGFALDFD